MIRPRRRGRQAPRRRESVPGQARRPEAARPVPPVVVGSFGAVDAEILVRRWHARIAVGTILHPLPNTDREVRVVRDGDVLANANWVQRHTAAITSTHQWDPETHGYWPDCCVRPCVWPVADCRCPIARQRVGVPSVAASCESASDRLPPAATETATMLPALCRNTVPGTAAASPDSTVRAAAPSPVTPQSLSSRVVPLDTVTLVPGNVW